MKIPHIQTSIKENLPENMIEESNEQQPFVYESRGVLVVFQRMSENYVMKYPRCNMETRYIVQHLNKRGDCTEFIDIEVFQVQFKIFKADHTKTRKRKADQLSKNKQRVENEAEVKEDQNKRKKANTLRQRAEDEEKLKEQ